MKDKNCTQRNAKQPHVATLKTHVGYVHQRKTTTPIPGVWVGKW